jgi:sulfatase maturation enzyme AslB (radical SAM superfamily)
MDTNLVLQLIDEAAAMGFDNIHMTGGEPGMHPDFQQICEYAHSKGLRVGITTNGTLAEKYRFLKDPKFLKRGLRPALRLSLDGPNAEVHDRSRKAGAFDKAMDFYKEFTEFGHAICLHTCISKWNYPYVPQLLNLAVELGTPHHTFGSVIHTTDDNEDMTLTPLERQLAIQCINRRRTALSNAKSKTRVGVATTLKNGTGPRFCTVFRYERSTLTLNPYGIWSFCCDVGLDGDMSIGKYPDVNLSDAFLGLHRMVEELVQDRLNFYQNNTFVEGWFDNCNYCNRKVGGKVVSDVDIRRKQKIIPIVSE